jgi:uncharacterized protein YodC (DUF2158 family)
MATKFKKGDKVVVNNVLPSGPVQALAMDEDGMVRYLITWKDIDGVEQTRWFNEDVLVAG